MKLVIGGAYQGKRAYAEEHFQITCWEKGDSCAKEAIFSCEGLVDFHLYVRRLLAAGKEAYIRERLVSDLLRENPQIVLVTNELGYGIVPIEAFDRNWRELTGRICTELASHAEKVIRVVCGIPVVLKEDRKPM